MRGYCGDTSPAEIALQPSAAFSWERDEEGAMPTEWKEPTGASTAIGNAITRLHREYHGRGATTTRTVISRNHVVVFLDDIYTPLERTLIDAGSWEQVKQTRQAFQMAMRERFTAAVENELQRKVVAFMSQVHVDPDMAAEIFALERLDSEETEPSRRAPGFSDGG
jgi:uncharacterized protein YbcI